jgi:hypothetical protein
LEEELVFRFQVSGFRFCFAEVGWAEVAGAWIQREYLVSMRTSEPAGWPEDRSSAQLSSEGTSRAKKIKVRVKAGSEELGADGKAENGNTEKMKWLIIEDALRDRKGNGSIGKMAR